jgi:hypothetical protein
MRKSRLTRLWSRAVPITATVVVVWVVAPVPSAWAAPASEAGGLTAPVTSDPFNPVDPGDVSDGKGLLPPADNSPTAGPVVENALPGAHETQTRFRTPPSEHQPSPWPRRRIRRR